MKLQYLTTVRFIYLRQDLVFSSCSHVAALQSELAFWLVLCLKLFDISSSSSSLELQYDVTELYCVPTCNLAKWHSSSRIRSMVQVVLLWFAKDNGPDLLAGVLWRAGDELLNGVWHLEVVQLPRGVISVPTSLRATSLQASFTASAAASPNKNPSPVGSEHCKFGKMGTVLSVNLSAFQIEFHYLCRRCSIYKIELNHII